MILFLENFFGFVDIILFVKCNIEYYGNYNVNIIIKIGYLKDICIIEMLNYKYV